MINMDAKIEAWKNKLLDLGKRNRLLNYRDTKRSSLKIKVPEIYDLWNSFVIQENSIEFPFLNDFENDVDAEMSLGDIVTNQEVKDQQKTLRNLRDKAKTLAEEQGVNALYLAFGFLKWSESENSKQYLNSPLVLVPANLILESITAPFILKLHEDEIVVNPTLIYKLDVDFGIKLPEFNPENSLEEYLNGVANLVSRNKWEIVSDVGLSLFSFLKINMYNDLESHKDLISSHPVIRALGGDSSAVDTSVEELNNFDHDRKTTPADTYQVVDADSSQQDAIICAKKGLSFVLQGPPGTGKSQTITNIIAECLADGKKVLFVSEKMAALDVVYRRLAKAGLNDFCLSLHSHKANKKEILEQLGQVLTLSRQKADLSDEAYRKLDLLQSDKEKLNEYAEAIFTSVQPFGKTIYEVNGYLANLENYSDVVFDIENVAATTVPIFNRYINLLNRFTETVGKMSDDYKSNPWNGANVAMVSNELRHDINAYIAKLIPKVVSVSALYDRLEEELQIEHDFSYIGMHELEKVLGQASLSPRVPVSWIIGDDVTPLFGEVEECSSLKAEYERLESELLALASEAKSKDADFSLEFYELTSMEKLKTKLFELEDYIDNHKSYSIWNALNELHIIAEDWNLAEEKITEYNSKKSELLEEFEISIFDIDYNSMLKRFKTDYTSIFKVFNSQYREDKKCIRGLYKNIVKKLSDESVIDTISKLRYLGELKQWMYDNSDSLAKNLGELFDGEHTDFVAVKKALFAFNKIKESQLKLEEIQKVIANITEKELELKAHFDFMYSGIETDWSVVLDALMWAKGFRDIVDNNNIGNEFVSCVCNSKEFAYCCGEYRQLVASKMSDLELEFAWYLNLFDNKEEIKSLRMPALQDKLEKCLNGMSALEEWIDFRTAKENCCSEGLSDYIEKIGAIRIETSNIVPIFKKRFFRLWLDAVTPDYPAVANFRRKIHEGIIDEFARLDKLQFKIAKARIRSKLINNLPSWDHFTSGLDEISILKRELGKRRKIMPIRKLFKSIPNLVLTLKPCLMMSPLSVSLFLEAESYAFDTVIFDEASQVCTENAIGAIARGKQVIIAGDSKQLPPTNFFAATAGDTDFDLNDDDEYDDAGAYESILDEAGLLPERTLLWHYRSRHEHLIAFSNAKIYKNNLITFPSNIDKVRDNGVEYIHVKDGVYDRGGKNGNVKEAEKIAELVLEHFKKSPDRSLGIIAFGEVQQQAIDTAIRQMRMRNQQYEPFFNEDKEEPFFIKNLENVQGDERDTIIFSIGYAKDATGRMYMNFGPLSKVGGERRLNVAITRAKFNVKLVGSIFPTDIEVERISSEGPKLLRSYIDFAINGTSVLLREITESDRVEHDSPFEEAVYNFLDRKGYKIGTQIGCSGYRIDMAVKHPTLSGCYVIGIECDGAAYHSARTARERDRLRQSVLEDMGWKIYRIWSTDWIKDPIAEGGKLVEAIERAISEYGDNSIDGFEYYDDEKKEDFLEIVEKSADCEVNSNPYGFADFTPTSFDKLPVDDYGYLQLSDCIKAVVDNEFPIHYDLLCKNVAHLFGNEKVTVKVRKEVDFGLEKLTGTVTRKGDFLYPANFPPIVVKMPNTRPISYISCDEFVEAMHIIASKCVGATRESLCAETARAYGFNRSGTNITAALNKAYDQLISSRRAREIEGKVVAEAQSY